MPLKSRTLARLSPSDLSTWRAALRNHWFLYLYEGAELALFMLSACAFTVWLFLPSAAAVRLVPDAALRRVLMGIAMGATAILLIHSPMGKQSGAHFNPAITLTYLRLGKISTWDALFYVLGQFLGGIFGVGIAALLFDPPLATPPAQYAITIPGVYGTAAAFAAELFMAFLLMLVVLWTSNRPSLAGYTSCFVGLLIAVYILLFAPVSGFSINPARTTASACFAEVWTAVWIYFTAPLLGMLAAAELRIRISGRHSVLCAKLHPDASVLCPFNCTFPGHRHQEQSSHPA